MGVHEAESGKVKAHSAFSLRILKAHAEHIHSARLEILPGSNEYQKEIVSYYYETISSNALAIPTRSGFCTFGPCSKIVYFKDAFLP